MFHQVETRIMPVDVVTSKAGVLGVLPEVRQAAQQIAKNFTDHGIEEGKKPNTIAGVSFFMAIMKVKGRSSDVESVWRQISETVKIGVSTMKECYHNALASEDVLMPKWLQSRKQ